MPGGLRELLTRRRLGGAALVLAGLAVAVAVLWPVLGGGDGEDANAKAVRLVSVPQLGLAFAHPRSWTRSVKGRVIRLRSPDGSAVMTFASPVAGRQPQRVKAALERELRRQLKPVTVIRDGPGRLGGRKVSTLELRGSTRGGRVRALALVATTQYRTYAVTLLTPARPSRKRLEEVSQILATVDLVKPRRAAR